MTVSASLALTAAALSPGTASRAVAATRSGCPAAESLVPVTKWTHHTLRKGITLAEGKHRDSRGVVDMHVLRVDLSNHHISVGPLVKTLTQRSPLSSLTDGHRHLIAASNTGYFDFLTGAPTGPFVVHRAPVVMSLHHERVAGVTDRRRAQIGSVWLHATATVGSSRRRVAAVNELRVPAGLSVYTPLWGARHVHVHSDSITRVISATRQVGALGRRRTVPSSGVLLVGTGAAAESWLRSIGSGRSISLRMGVATSAARPFVQAYGVGNEIVTRSGHARSGFGCDSANTKTPARTAIGYAHRGRQLVIGFVTDHPHTSQHGLDQDQMSRFMEQLGVSKAAVFDGSGSTELLARMPRTSHLAMRTYPADGVERPMPLGLGIYKH